MMRSMTFVATASPVSFGMKSGVQPCIGCGLKAGMRRRRRAVGIARLLDAAAEELRILRLTDDDSGLGPLLGEHPRDALQRSAGAVAGHPIVEPLAGEIVDDLARRGARMDVGVGLVLELPRQEPAMRLGQLDASS